MELCGQFEGMRRWPDNRLARLPWLAARGESLSGWLVDSGK
jgi:hypothetical protein